LSIRVQHLNSDEKMCMDLTAIAQFAAKIGSFFLTKLDMAFGKPSTYSKTYLSNN